MSSSLFLGGTVRPYITSFTRIPIILTLCQQKKLYRSGTKDLLFLQYIMTQPCISAQLNKAHEPSELFLLH